MDDRKLGLLVLGVIAVLLSLIPLGMLYLKLTIPGELWTILSGVIGGIIGIIKGVKPKI